MRRITVFVVLGLLAVSAATASATAQERSLSEALRHINQLLRDNAYTDHDGRLTYSRVTLSRDGKLVATTTKASGATKVANEYTVSVEDLDPDRIEARQRGSYMSLSLGATGPVTAKLRCFNPGGTTYEWDLPVAREISVEFRSDMRLAGELTRALAALIREARGGTG